MASQLIHIKDANTDVVTAMLIQAVGFKFQNPDWLNGRKTMVQKVSWWNTTRDFNPK